MTRFQYRVVQLGMFNAVERKAGALAHLGEHGRELIGVHDKSSNWWHGMEKGFALFKRSVPDGQEPDGEWCAVDDRNAYARPTNVDDGTPQFYG